MTAKRTVVRQNRPLPAFVLIPQARSLPSPCMPSDIHEFHAPSDRSELQGPRLHGGGTTGNQFELVCEIAKLKDNNDYLEGEMKKLSESNAELRQRVSRISDALSQEQMAKDMATVKLQKAMELFKTHGVMVSDADLLSEADGASLTFISLSLSLSLSLSFFLSSFLLC
jgi:hypothetical protein